MAVSVAVEPTDDLLTVAQIKAYLRYDDTDQDDLITSLRDAAVAYAQRYTGRRFMSVTLDFSFDDFPASGLRINALGELVTVSHGGYSRSIELPGPPTQSITSVTYTDASGDSQTLSTDVYQLLTSDDGRSFLTEKYNQQWPDCRDIERCVTVRLVVGYEDADSVPDEIKLAVKMLVAEWFDKDRSGVDVAQHHELPFSVRCLLDGHRVRADFL